MVLGAAYLYPACAAPPARRPRPRLSPALGEARAWRRPRRTSFGSRPRTRAGASTAGWPRQLPRLSRARAPGPDRAGHVRVDGRPARRPRARPRRPDGLRARYPRPRPACRGREDIPLDVVHEDPQLLVVDKPAGLVVHPGARAARGHARQRAAAPRPRPLGRGRRAAPGHRPPPGPGHLGPDRRGQGRRDPPRARAASSPAARWRRSTWPSCSACRGPARARSTAAIGRDPVHRKRMSVRATRGPRGPILVAARGGARRGRPAARAHPHRAHPPDPRAPRLHRPPRGRGRHLWRTLAQGAGELKPCASSRGQLFTRLASPSSIPPPAGPCRSRRPFPRDLAARARPASAPPRDPACYHDGHGPSSPVGQPARVRRQGPRPRRGRGGGAGRGARRARGGAPPRLRGRPARPGRRTRGARPSVPLRRGRGGVGAARGAARRRGEPGDGGAARDGGGGGAAGGGDGAARELLHHPRVLRRADPRLPRERAHGGPAATPRRTSASSPAPSTSRRRWP